MSENKEIDSLKKKETRGRKKGCKNEHKKLGVNDYPAEVRHLRKAMTVHMDALNRVYGDEVVTFNGGYQLDLQYGWCFRATGKAWMSYAVDTPTNRDPNRLTHIKRASLANYQLNVGGNFIWTYEQMFNDVLAVLSGGIMRDPEIDRKVSTDSIADGKYEMVFA
jgi:hypothetical protein